MKILITGGSRGIGKSIVSIFRDNKHEVYSPTRDQLNLLDIDIKLVKTNFDIVINNAGINPLIHIQNINNEDVMRVNYFSPFKIIQQCLPYMINQSYGRIVNIGSIWIELAKPARAAYAASKHALHSLTKALTAEYAQYNILSNTISPGFIGTDLTYQNNTIEQIDQIIKNIPSRRLGDPDEVAKLVYQMTVENTFITGQNIMIDGGYTCTAH
jgi:NAD(P)-dependent dehydrogenase (short-subunit alcohol dehydrogenase family)